MNAGRVKLSFDLRKEAILPFTIWTGRSITHAFGLTNDHQTGPGVQTLQFRNGSNEAVATAVGLQASVHKGDDGLPLFENCSIGQLQRCRRRIGQRLSKINTIVNDADFSPPVLWEAAGLEVV